MPQPKSTTRIVPLVAVFLLGTAVGVFAAKKRPVDPSSWQGLSPQEASANLMTQAKVFAEDGSWENIYWARTQYLMGEKEAAEEVFRHYTEGKKVEASDVIRIGRVYAEAGDWDQAKAHFARVVDMEPRDEDWLAEIGAWYNLNGEREHAEKLFARSVDEGGKDLDNTLSMAGSYRGVRPRR